MKNHYKTVIVTGGSGFIGSHLVDALIDNAECVIVIDKVKPPKNRKNNRAKYIKINIQDKDVINVFEKYKPELVFHLAAHLHDRESVEKPVENAMDNIIGFLNVCEGVRKSTNAKIIFTSSCAVYGIHDNLPISEEVVPVPTTPYGITKLTGEKYLHFYKQKYNTPYVAFRPGNIYGPRQDASAESGVIGIFSSRLLKGKTTVINNDGQTTRDYIYVSDVVDALLKAAESDFVGILNLGTGIQTTTADIFEKVKTAVGGGAMPDRNENQPDATKYMALDASKSQKTLDWKPKVDLEQGIKQTVAWYRGE
ncbi:MAG: nucleoside-diphosphate-sugar epimerase [uncultured bacterium]|uniref:Nucleoside-diphosphate-sugar epimerase n=1 Tax=Candidatus Uhrbacteria bacterium GW2011_GWC1_41_20 TaxID=1618983 RepID=A0A0G0VD71_9BACT|nr:MAG: nucleoside-diphosphate-sugar epimerase [uncultured bacterium]KKR22982.1 MAG: Nucleoside-diphosphate-sugar epimerase [Candidatus Uhrbacteria bacterium GW2011_GWE1_39_46]KKR63774.1 MAG: Nucleoside-diphosphate-sugar epimerase [Candidatus Uhrbacteria bacterium GW2011_GWC2_40_450]KKR89833.1 MAG: Nucleoside-diphosphate-sugar epimerase [Candidatus Uhrbacteria bacterium GW2011_GWD2_41_121]KKR95739.1 MAG: Nucleoside-diphosphate-sugar epimerase [Candidatus Uhrbacteria bacterium GW2011_GWD1_41_16]